MAETTALLQRASHHAHRPLTGLLRSFVIALTAFLTVVDLFATQAILPSLARAYGVGAATMGLAVNASTIGMAIAGLLVALFSRHIDRKRGTLISLCLLAIPTALLALMPAIAVFAALRVVQGLFMSAAFTLTLAYLAEHSSAEDTASAAAAYITGNVASNLLGRPMAAALADHLGLAANFAVFAMLNLAGALLVYVTLSRTPPMRRNERMVARSFLSQAIEHLRNPALLVCFGIGFCILFAFTGTSTYVNFVLCGHPSRSG